MNSSSDDLKDMTNLLRQGAKLTSLSCPACSSPLFRMLSGELWCASCKKRVVVVREGRSAEAMAPVVLNEMEGTLLRKIDELNRLIDLETDPDKIRSLGAVIKNLLENLNIIRKIVKREG